MKIDKIVWCFILYTTVSIRFLKNWNHTVKIDHYYGSMNDLELNLNLKTF